MAHAAAGRSCRETVGVSTFVLEHLGHSRTSRLGVQGELPSGGDQHDGQTLLKSITDVA